MKSLITLILLLWMPFAYAQVKVEATATGKHAKTISTMKEAKGLARRKKEQFNRLKEQKKAMKKYEQRYDKLKKEKLEELKIDSVKIQLLTREDSVALANRVLYETKFPEEYLHYILNQLPLDTMVTSSLDTSSLSIDAILESQLKQYLPDELSNSTASPPDQLATNPLESRSLENENLPIIKKPTKPNPNLIKPTAARDLFSKIDLNQFQQIQADITKLKKKFSSLPDTRFPMEGRKRNSLDSLPFLKRLYLGGTVNASSTDPLILDADVQLGYWINKKWMTGVGLSGRHQFAKSDSTTLTGNAHGYSLFTRYDIMKQFFAWGELQRKVNRSILQGDATDTRWQEAYLIGIGREFKIGPVRMTSLVMYDFSYQNNDLIAQPLVFRVGIHISKKPE